MKAALVSILTALVVFTALSCIAADDYKLQVRRQQPQTQPNPQTAPQPPTPPAAPDPPISQTDTYQSAAFGDCCTPEATARMAASAGFIDILGIKTGMSAEQAVAALKAANPAFKIDMLRNTTNWDYLAQLSTDSRSDPKKQWLIGIQGTGPMLGSSHLKLFSSR